MAGSPVLSPDGNYVMYNSNGEARRGILIRDLRSADSEGQEFEMSPEALEPVAIVPARGFAIYWRFSRGRPATFLKSLSSGGSTWEVPGLTDGPGRLLPGARTIGEFQIRADGTAALVAVPFETSPTVTFGAPQDLFTNLPETLRLGSGFDLSPDGKRLLGVVSRQAGPIQRGIVVVTNWFSEFRPE